MKPGTEPVITRAEERPREAWDDPSRGSVTWFTLISQGLTPTESMCAGLAELRPGDSGLTLHRHAEPEIYFVADGAGIVTIDGRDTAVRKGDAVFIPGDAEHGLRNESDALLRVFYVFPVGRFSDVVYRFGA